MNLLYVKLTVVRGYYSDGEIKIVNLMGLVVVVRDYKTVLVTSG